MSFLNRFLIEEDIQFEIHICAGVVERYGDMERNLVKNLKRISNNSNSDFIDHLVLSHDSYTYFNGYSIWNNIKNLR